MKARAAGRCDYCGTSTRDAPGSVWPLGSRRADAAVDDDDALYCCDVCNVALGNDGGDETETRLLNPRLDSLGEHVEEHEGGVLAPRTEEGRFYIERLRLNRAALVEERHARRLLALARRADEDLRALLALKRPA